MTVLLVRTLTLFGLVLPGTAFALAPPVYTPPVSKVGGAVGQSIAENLIRRGFAADDPLIARTVSAVAADATSVVSGTSAASWLTVAADVTPWVLGGVLVYQGVNWYFDIQGKTYLSPPGTKTTAPVFSNGIVAGQNCWGVDSSSSDCWGSVQESLSYSFYATRQQYPKSSYGVPQINNTSATTATATYNYSIPELYLNNYSGSKNFTVRKAVITCASGMGYVGSTCVSANLDADSSPWKGAAVVGSPIADAYNALPDAAKKAPMSTDLAAELANRVWQHAASQPGYKGYPFPSGNPVTPGDAAKYRDRHPDVFPPLGDLPTPLPAPTVAPPVVIPDSYPPAPGTPTPTTTTTTGTTTAADGTKSTTSTTSTIDWGTFTPPDLDTPTIESILDPLFSMWPSWQNFAFPQHSSVCPTPSFTLPASIVGGATISFSQVCDWTESVRPTLQVSFAVAWAILIVFIVMGA